MLFNYLTYLQAWNTSKYTSACSSSCQTDWTW